MFKQIRITILLLVLVIVAGDAWLTALRSTNWDVPLDIVVYPVNGDGSVATSQYINALDRDVFKPVAHFIGSEGARYQLSLLEPVSVDLAPEVTLLPPVAPFGGNILNVMLWSLKMRWWAWRVDTYDDPADIRVFVLYFDPAVYKKLDHSLGLKEGLLCQVNGFASNALASRSERDLATKNLCREFDANTDRAIRAITVISR